MRTLNSSEIAEKSARCDTTERIFFKKIKNRPQNRLTSRVIYSIILYCIMLGLYAFVMYILSQIKGKCKPLCRNF